MGTGNVEGNMVAFHIPDILCAGCWTDPDFPVPTFQTGSVSGALLMY